MGSRNTQSRQRAFLASEKLLTEKIQSQSESINDLIIVGHNPGLSELSSSLLKQSIYLPTSGCVSLNINLDLWDLETEIMITDKTFIFQTRILKNLHKNNKHKYLLDH